MLGKRNLSLIAIILCITIAPTANASSSGLNFINSTMSTATDAYTNTVTISPDGTLIASSYNTFVEIHNASNYEFIEIFDLGRDVYHIDFSPDGRYIAATTVAQEAIPDSVQIIDTVELAIKSNKARGNNRPLTVIC